MGRISFHKLFQAFLVGALVAIAIIAWVRDLFLSLFLWAFFLCLIIPVLVEYKKYLSLSISLLIWMIIGGAIGWVHISKVHARTELLSSYMWTFLAQSWQVKELYKRSEYYDEYLLETRKLGNNIIDNGTFHIIRIPKNFELDTWQIISYSGKIYPLEDFDGFSYKNFMLSRWIYFSTSATSFETISNDKSGWKYVFASSRSTLLSQIDRIFPEQEAIFLWGILFWARENIPKELKEDFNNSGLTHFIAVSGFNITLCIIFVTFLFGFLPVAMRIILVSLTIVWFSLFVGLWAPVVRAAIMGLIGYVFLQNGSGAKNITLILFTAVCMSIYSPLSLIYDVSLHLSFLAVIGIIYTQEILWKIFYWIPSVFAIREAFILTLAALSFSLPVMIFQFGQVSLLAPFANIAVTWTIPLAMIWGAITLIGDSVSSWIGRFFGFPTWILLHYDMLMVNFFWNIDSALLRSDFWAYKDYLQALYFIILIYTLCLYHQRNTKQPE